MGEPSSPRVEASPKVPAVAADLAARGQLGAPLMARKGDNPIAILGICVVLALGLFGIAALINWLLESVRFRLLGIVAVLAVLGGIFVIGYGFYSLFQGFRATYLYQGGLVWTLNGRAQAAAWGEIDRMYLPRSGQNRKIASCEVITIDGRRVQIAPREETGRDEFIERLEGVFGELRRPVVPTFLAEVHRNFRKDSGLDDQTVVRIGAVVAVLGSIACGALLWFAGFPGPVAAVLGPLVVGAAQIALGIRLEARLVTVGYIALGLAGVIAIIVAVKPFSGVTAVVVAVAVLAAEAGVVAIWKTIRRRLPAPSANRRRQQLAQRLGWQFQPRATLSLPGPETTRHLIGVPNNAAVTTGNAVLHGTINQIPVTVYDRARRTPRLGDPVQTVWEVTLPFALPYLSSEKYLRVVMGAALGDGESSTGGHWPDPGYARLLAATPAFRGVAEAPGMPGWWIEQNQLYAAIEPSAPAAAINPIAERLTALAAAMPWQELHRSFSAGAGH